MEHEVCSFFFGCIGNFWNARQCWYDAKTVHHEIQMNVIAYRWFEVLCLLLWHDKIFVNPATFFDGFVDNNFKWMRVVIILLLFLLWGSLLFLRDLLWKLERTACGHCQQLHQAKNGALKFKVVTYRAGASFFVLLFVRGLRLLKKKKFGDGFPASWFVEFRRRSRWCWRFFRDFHLASTLPNVLFGTSLVVNKERDGGVITFLRRNLPDHTGDSLPYRSWRDDDLSTSPHLITVHGIHGNFRKW